MATIYEQLQEQRREIKRLRAQLRWYKLSRNGWRTEARGWRWACENAERKLSTRSTALSPTERAEAS